MRESAAALFFVLLQALHGPLFNVQCNQVGGEAVELGNFVVVLEASLDKDLRLWRCTSVYLD
jgi:hypothetical protein